MTEETKPQVEAGQPQLDGEQYAVLQASFLRAMEAGVADAQWLESAIAGVVRLKALWVQPGT